MSTPTPGGVAFVSYQLDVMQKLIGYTFTPGHPDEWNHQAIDTLAQTLFAYGVTDVRDLGFYVGTQQGMTPRQVPGGETEAGIWYTTVQEPVTFPVCWFFNRRNNTRVYLGESITDYCQGIAHENESGTYYEPCPVPPNPATDEIGFGPLQVNFPDRWWLTFGVRFVGPDPATAVAVFLPHMGQEKTTWQRLRSGLLFIFGAVAMVVPGIGQAIGSYVFGSLAASYPTLVALTTQTAFNAALGGQDIEHAVGGALAGLAGNVAGGYAGAQINSTLVAKATAAVTTALLKGTDVGQAVSAALAQSGAGVIQSAIESPTPSTKEPPMTFDDTTYDPTAVDTSDYAFGGTIDLGMGFAPQDLTFGLGDVVTFGGDQGQPITFDESGNVVDGSAGVDISSGLPANVPPAAPSDGFDFGDIIAGVTQTAMAALKIYQATRGQTAPVAAVGPSQTVNRNGTVTTRSPDGTVTVGKPPAGTPVAVGDGSLIVNNGDGTYTLIDKNGAQQRVPYGQAPSAGLGGLSSTQLAMLAAGGLGLLFLLKRR